MTQFWLDAQVKAVGDDATGGFEAVASVPSVDRDGEVIAKGAFDPLPDYEIPIHVDHNMSVATLVGVGKVFYEGDDLRIKGRFSSDAFAQNVRSKVNEGILGWVSVGFMGAKTQVKDGVPTITKAELLEVSLVTVPSNRDARVLISKSGARNNTKDAERLQNIHDLAVDNGAMCGAAKAVEVAVITKDAAVLAETAQGSLELLAAAIEGGDIAAAADLVSSVQETLAELVLEVGAEEGDDDVDTESATAPGTDATGADEENAELELRARVLALLAAAG